MENDRESRSINTLFSELVNDLTSLFRQEVRLAKAEMSEKVSQVGSGVASMAIGGAVVFAGFLVLLASAVLGLSYWLAPWLSALIIGGLVVAIGAAMLVKGRENVKSRNLAPSRTIESLRRDKDFAREHMGRTSA